MYHYNTLKLSKKHTENHCFNSVVLLRQQVLRIPLYRNRIQGTGSLLVEEPIVNRSWIKKPAEAGLVISVTRYFLP